MAFKKEVAEIIEPRDIFVGNAKADITLEEFGEYESEVCANANEIVKKLLVEYDQVIRFNFRHFPLTNVHQRSLKAGEAAVATGQEGKFWEMHNILFANRKNLGTTSLKLYSKEAGVQNKRFLDDLVNATYGWQVQGDLREGLNRGVTTVPTFFVNGVRVAKPTYEDIKKEIEQAIKDVKTKGKSKPVSKRIEMVEDEVEEVVVKAKPTAKTAQKKVAVKAAPKTIAKTATKAAPKAAAKVAPKAKAKQRA
jgi:predicted DsbA family dithiol-disulfide isomerase